MYSIKSKRNWKFDAFAFKTENLQNLLRRFRAIAENSETLRVISIYKNKI